MLELEDIADILARAVQLGFHGALLPAPSFCAQHCARQHRVSARPLAMAARTR
jgi:hypothetical protein